MVEIVWEFVVKEEPEASSSWRSAQGVRGASCSHGAGASEAPPCCATRRIRGDI